jgi:DNA replication and repair protein RecF
VISQSDKGYLSSLINYNKILSQRNSLLKYFAANHTYNNDTIEVYNQQLQLYGTEIFKKRKEFLDNFIPLFKAGYKAISNNNEDVSVEYKSDLFENDLDQLLRKASNKDKA